MPQRRRLDRILADDYLTDLSDRSTREARRMRDECAEEELRVSFTRRVLQGRLDIARSELARRQREAADGGAGTLIDELPSILGDRRTITRPIRFRATRAAVPASVEHHRRSYERSAGRPVAESLSSSPTEELTELVEEIAEQERSLSALRQRLFGRIDALQDDLASRYATGQADISELLGGS